MHNLVQTIYKVVTAKFLACSNVDKVNNLVCLALRIHILNAPHLQMLMNVSQTLVTQTLNAQTLLEAITVPVTLDTLLLEMGIGLAVQVNI